MDHKDKLINEDAVVIKMYLYKNCYYCI